ncbi:MAG: ATP-dependent zinc metalloprotease FtsH [Eubacteriaceae bacterium]|nr:ATP-dependent zinc metalloprotease FtsH [Eubacteriaceae bacterium]
MIFGSGKKETVSYNDFTKYLNNNMLKEVVVSIGSNGVSYVEAELKTSTSKNVTAINLYLPSDKLSELLDAYTEKYPNSIEIKYKVLSEGGWTGILMTIATLSVIGFALFLIISQQAAGNSSGRVMNFGKSKARIYQPGDKKVTFEDVAGADEEKQELEEIVDFLKHPERYKKLGARIPKGVLLVGLPGTGKTLLARATAGEAGVPFFTISGSDFVEMFVGVGASRVRDLFDSAKKNSPCIIFIDEIDAVGRYRGAGLGGGNDEREQTLNQLLVEMDGFTDHQNIIILAATNRADILDPALLRPGRFDRQITVHVPDVKGREEILKVHARQKPVADDVDFSVIAKATTGMTGADLENVMNEASLMAARNKADKITMDDIRESIKRVIAGPEKKSMVVTDRDKQITAYHEVGHAVVASSLKECDPVMEISIIPRGSAAGYTINIPDNDDNHVSRTRLLNEITMCLGGRASEEVMLSDICTGAVSDIQRATQIARKMITDYGMSDVLGPISYGEDDDNVFIGKDLVTRKVLSEEVASKIDSEVKRIMDTCYSEAKKIVSANKDKIDRIVKTLYEKETLTGDEFRELFFSEPHDESPEGEQEAQDAPDDNLSGGDIGEKRDATDMLLSYKAPEQVMVTEMTENSETPETHFTAEDNEAETDGNDDAACAPIGGTDVDGNSLSDGADQDMPQNTRGIIADGADMEIPSAEEVLRNAGNSHNGNGSAEEKD